MNILDVLQRAQEVCASCGVRKLDLLLCPCRQVHYCSTPCQVQHWKTHRLVCTKGVTSEGKRPPVKHCYYCGRASYHIRGCQCGLAFYCDAQCQAKHWGQHRRNCSTWDVDVADATANAAAAVAVKDPRIMRIRRKDAEVQTEGEVDVRAKIHLDAIAADWRTGSHYVTTQRPSVRITGNAGTHEDGEEISGFHGVAGTPSDAALALQRHASVTLGPRDEEQMPQPSGSTPSLEDAAALHLLGVDGLYNSVIIASTHTSDHPTTDHNNNTNATSDQQHPHQVVEVDGRALALTTPPSGFEFSGLLPTAGGDLSIRTATSDGAAAGRSRTAEGSHRANGSASESGGSGRQLMTSKALAAHRVHRERVASVTEASNSSDGNVNSAAEQLLAKMTPVNPLNIDAVNAQRTDIPPPAGGAFVSSSTSFHRLAPASSGHPRRGESDSVVDALQPTASFVIQHNTAASPSNALTRKGTVMSNVLSGAAAHLNRSRSGASGVFAQSSSRMFINHQQPDAKTAQLQRELEEAIEEFVMDEEEERLDIANDRIAQLSTMETVVKRFLFMESAKLVGVEEESARLELLTQYNLWLRTSAMVAFRRVRKS
ncbi:zinc finger protein, putative [Bodo saltans]|uniref:Zinc finger protein, putative n=1 Tax=Bodo saltans TaxID=75058 RepID=A0A0S4JII1_BODSA|nr:zinc finger protein, putative [Bodo saltans]|eukprot:CUG89867.1 zinc finger protein, putative [Bodo saltans]